MQVPVKAREVLTDLLFEREPIVLYRIEVGRVRGQELLSAACPLKKAAGFLGPMKAGVITEDHLAGVEDRHQAVLDIRCEEGGIAVALEDKRRDEGVVVKGIKNTYALSVMARLLAPTRLAPRTPAVRASFVVIDPRFIEIHKLFRGDSRSLRAKPRALFVVALRIAKGLFLCVSPSLRRDRQIVIRFTPPHASASSSTVASPWACTKALNRSGSVIFCECPRWYPTFACTSPVASLRARHPVIVSRCTPTVRLASVTPIPCSTAATTRMRKS
jgi:hypothetical protein